MKTGHNVIAGKKVSLPDSLVYSIIGNLLILLMIFSLSAAVVMLREDIIGTQLQTTKEKIGDFTSQMGFVVDDVIIEGRKNTLKSDVANALNINRGDNVLQYNLWQAKRNLEALPWVKEAFVRRSFFPNVIYVSLVEKNVIALWQFEDNFYPIDEDGQVISSDYVPPVESLLIIGPDAPENVNSLLNVLKQDKDLFQRVKAAVFVSGRRWDIILDDIENGLTVKLPEEDMQKAWKKLIKLSRTEGLLKRKLTFIDLRLKGKVIVKLEKDSNNSKIKNKKEHQI